MTVNEFLKKARAGIPDNPRDRLCPQAKAVLDHPDCVIDIHAHIFDRKCLNVPYVLLRLGKHMSLEALGLEGMEDEMEELHLLKKDTEQIYEEMLEKAAEGEEDWAQLEKELEQIIELNEMYELFGFDLKEAFKILKKKDMLAVYDYYLDNLAIIKLPAYRQNKMATVVLQMDLESGWPKMRPKRRYLQQIEDLKDIMDKRPIIPYLAVDPRRAELEGDANLYQAFIKAFTDTKRPFFGVKCYPALGYFPSDVRLEPIFQICIEKNIPVLTHCGGEIISTFSKKFQTKNEHGYSEFQIPGDSRKKRARFLNDPIRWKPVLDKFPKLKLNLGHFGGDESWEHYGKPSDQDKRIETIISMIENPDLQVYTDFSYNLINPDLFEPFKKVLDGNPSVAKRIIYGTDYWVVLPVGELLKMQGEFLGKMKAYDGAMLRANALGYLLG